MKCLYTESVNNLASIAVEAVQDQLRPMTEVNINSFPMVDTLENDFHDLCSNFLEERLGLGQYRSHN